MPWRIPRRGRTLGPVPLTEPLEPRRLLCGDVPAPADSTEALPRDLTAWSATPKRVLYILARFADQPPEAAPAPAAAKSSMAQVDRIMRDNSYGRVSFGAEVTQVVVLPRRAAGEGGYGDDWQQILADARDLARAAGAAAGSAHDWDYRNYDLYTVRYNGGPGNFVGAAPVRARRSWLKNDSPWVAAHEFGHNLGLWHANGLEPQEDQTVTGRGQNQEYGNPFDVMGRDGHDGAAFNAWEKNRLGWLPDAYVTTADPGDAVHTYTIYPFDTATALRRGRKYAIRVRKDADAITPTDRRDYWIDFRQAEAWTRIPTPDRPNPTFNAGLADGVEINWCPWGPAGSTIEEQTTSGSNGGSQLLDMTPQTRAASPESPGRGDGALVIGRTFGDELAGVRITPLRKRADGGIDVRINFGDAGTPNHAPTALIATSAAGVAPGRPVVFSATASDPDGDTLAYAWDFGDGTFAARDGDGDRLNDAFNKSVAKRWDAPGDYRVRVTVSDMKGGTTSTSTMVRVSAAGTVFPSRRVEGVVRDMLGAPIPDVRISGAGRSALTDFDGRYTLSLPPAQDLPVLGAAKPGWRFEAAAPAVGNAATSDFDGIEVGYHVGGKVTAADGTPMSGVLASVGSASAVTDADGDFLIPVPNGTYTIRLSRPGYSFPAVAPFNVEYSDKSLNGSFFGNPTYVVAEEAAINGQFLGLDPDTGTDIKITVRASTSAGERSDEANMTFEYGNPYYVLRVPVGTSTLTASGVDSRGKHYSFSPIGWDNPLAVSGSAQAINFRLDERAGYELFGRVTYADGIGVAGAIVRAGGRTTTTAEDGSYALHGLSSGHYGVFATKRGMKFLRGAGTIADGDAMATPVVAGASSPGNRTPRILVAVAVSTSVTYRGTWLSVLGQDDRPAERLRYTWDLLFKPPGGAATFSVSGQDLNGTNSARRVLALFNKPGIYVMWVKATDEDGAESAPSYVRVFVGPELRQA